MKTIATIAAAAVLFAAPAFAQDYRITAQHIGCTQHETVSRFIRMANSGDTQAATNLVMAGMRIGQCTLFKPGERVHLSKTRLRSGMVQIRRPGEIQEFYVVMEAITK